MQGGVPGQCRTIQGPEHGAAAQADAERSLPAQSSEELRLPVELGEVQAALEASYADVPWQGEPVLTLELRASLSCATAWAPMVRLAGSFRI